MITQSKRDPGQWHPGLGEETLRFRDATQLDVAPWCAAEMNAKRSCQVHWMDARHGCELAQPRCMERRRVESPANANQPLRRKAFTWGVTGIVA